jgi:hypothetical protein
MDIEFITNNWYLFAALIVISLLIGIDTMRRGAWPQYPDQRGTITPVHQPRKRRGRRCL